MKELNIKYDIDLGRIIKCSKKKTKCNRKDEKIIEANYILESLAQNELAQGGIEATKEDLQGAISKTVETAKTKIKKADGTKISRRKVIKQYYMAPKEKLEIIRQVTEYIYKNGNKQFTRNTSVLETKDMIREGILTEDGKLNRRHTLVKKLLPEKKSNRIRTAK